jgi:hypothetical protein
MEDLPKLEAAYKGMTKKKRLRLVAYAIFLAERNPSEQANNESPDCGNGSHLRVVYTRNSN